MGAYISLFTSLEQRDLIFVGGNHWKMYIWQRYHPIKRNLETNARDFDKKAFGSHVAPLYNRPPLQWLVLNLVTTKLFHSPIFSTSLKSRSLIAAQKYHLPLAKKATPVAKTGKKVETKKVWIRKEE